jgi:hypothetical protein
MFRVETLGPITLTLIDIVTSSLTHMYVFYNAQAL